MRIDYTCMLVKLVSALNIAVLRLTMLLWRHMQPLLKQAYSNILKMLPPKNENFVIKILIFFTFLLKT